MSLETGTYVNDLTITNPTSSDPKSQGDDHLRLIKTVLKNSFAGFPGMIVVTGTEAQGATVNDYVMTVSPAPAAYTTGMIVVFKATHTNTSTATFVVNALASKPIVDINGGAVAAGDIVNGALFVGYYDGTSLYILSGNDRGARGGDTYTGTQNFTGATITVPTQTAADNSTKAASTAYVDAADALKANLASPTFTGNVSVPTPTAVADAVTKAYADGLAFATALPAQTGNSGKTITTDGSTASWSTLASIIGDHEVVVTTGNGHGSTNTKIRRFTTTQSSTGTAITYADSAANGGSFTINATGLYSVYYLDGRSGGQSYFGISVNSAQLTTDLRDITAANRLTLVANVANLSNSASKTVLLTAGDVVRAHTDGTTDLSTVYNTVFSIRKVA